MGAFSEHTICFKCLPLWLFAITGRSVHHRSVKKFWRLPRVSAPCKVNPAGTRIGTGNAQGSVHNLENLPPMLFSYLYDLDLGVVDTAAFTRF